MKERVFGWELILDLYSCDPKKIATKKDALKLTNFSWVPVYDGLISEIKLRHYSPKTPILPVI
jgi:hypothetical protein